MQVSNSTGQNTDYRVGTGGGVRSASLTQASLAGTSTSFTTTQQVEGQLPPGGSDSWDTDGWCTVEFTICDTTVSASFCSDPGEVVLVERNGTFAIESTMPATQQGERAA